MKNLLLLLALLANFGVYAAAVIRTPSQPARYANENNAVAALSYRMAKVTDEIAEAREAFDRVIEPMLARNETPKIGDASWVLAGKVQRLEKEYDRLQQLLAEELLK